MKGMKHIYLFLNSEQSVEAKCSTLLTYEQNEGHTQPTNAAIGDQLTNQLLNMRSDGN